MDTPKKEMCTRCEEVKEIVYNDDENQYCQSCMNRLEVQAEFNYERLKEEGML